MRALLRRLLHRESPAADPLASLNPHYIDAGGYQYADFKRCRCPDCGGEYFHPGPQGGAAVNIKCAGCGSKFWYGPPFAPHRIDNDDKYYRLNIVRKLEDL